MLIRWTEELAAMDFEVKHRPGRLNNNADALSCREDDLISQPTAQEEREQTECVNTAEEVLPEGFGKGRGPTGASATSPSGTRTMAIEPAGRPRAGGVGRLDRV